MIEPDDFIIDEAQLGLGKVIVYAPKHKEVQQARFRTRSYAQRHDRLGTESAVPASLSSKGLAETHWHRRRPPDLW
jgi:hypothetical protein